MTSNSRDSPPAGSGNRRRSSFVDMFASRPPVSAQPNPPRRLSITTLGLSAAGNGNQTPYNTIIGRSESISSSNSGSVDESPFEEDTFPNGQSSSTSASASTSASPGMPTSPFARRMSFGAKALGGREGRAHSISTPTGAASQSPQSLNGRAPSITTVTENTSTTSSSNTVTGSKASPNTREGYDFGETLRARAQRGSLSGVAGMGSNSSVSISAPTASVASHQRSTSQTMPPPPKEMPKLPRMPDAFQERILKGDFYMD